MVLSVRVLTPDAFGGLTRLHLHNLRFGRSDIPNILRTCKRLESLRLSSCDSGAHSVLQVEHARLVELDIADGYFSRVELSYLPELQRMSYSRWHYIWNPLVLGFVPRLSNLSLANAYVASDNAIKISQLLVNVPSISNLHLDFQREKVLTPSIFVPFSLYACIIESIVTQIGRASCRERVYVLV